MMRIEREKVRMIKKKKKKKNIKLNNFVNKIF